MLNLLARPREKPKERPVPRRPDLGDLTEIHDIQPPSSQSRIVESIYLGKDGLWFRLEDYTVPVLLNRTQLRQYSNQNRYSLVGPVGIPTEDGSREYVLYEKLSQ